MCYPETVSMDCCRLRSSRLSRWVRGVMFVCLVCLCRQTGIYFKTPKLVQSHANKRTHVLIQRVKWVDIRERERSSLKCSITGSDTSLPFLVLVVAQPPVLPVRMPPTHPSVAMRALRPRVHLASSSVSVELSPTTATTESLNVPAVMFREYKVTEEKKKSSVCREPSFNWKVYITNMHAYLKYTHKNHLIHK